jgi:hypothetical protein
MCFSASASFGAGVVLSVIGIATIKKVQHPSQIMFASIPLIFAIQQTAEGILWLTLPDPHHLPTQISVTYIFLFFAQIVWPLWVPVAILLLEKEGSRNMIQKLSVGAGIIVSLYLTYCLISFHVQAKIIGYHIAYQQSFPRMLKYYCLALYTVATIFPVFSSHVRRMWMFGVAIIISYIISGIFYEHYFLSVWCFFSSIISISIYAIILELKKSPESQSSSAVSI